jgi:hypothetical protein
MQSILTNKGLIPQKENVVLNWNTLQGYDYPSNEILQLRRKTEFRHITIQNGMNRGIGIAITTSTEHASKPQFGLKPGEVMDLAVNEFKINGPPAQYIHVFTRDGEESNSWIIRSDSNSFVVRENETFGGIYVQRYYYPTLRA